MHGRVGETRLLERTGELAQLAAGTDAITTGSGSVLVVEGAPGIGKSSLLAAAASAARARGCTVLTARAGHLDHDLGWNVVRQLFTEPVLRRSEPDRAELLGGAAAFATGPLGLAADLPDQPGSELDVSATLHGLYWLCSNLAERAPVVLAVDDAHWADAPSARWLSHLATRIADLPVLLLLSLRLDEPVPDDLSAARAGASRVLRPQPLSEQAGGHLIRSVVGVQASDELCQACHRATAGNPFLLRELALEIASGESGASAGVERVRGLTPETIVRTVLLRLGRLSPDARALALAVAVLGDGSTVAGAGELAGLEPPAAATAADALVAADLLRFDGRVEFAHPIVREVIYHDAPPVWRSSLHASAARLLADRGCPPEEVAVQLVAAPPADDPWVVERLRAAARSARTRAAPDAAVELLTRALAERSGGPDAELLHELGAAEAVVKHPAAASHLREALQRAADPLPRYDVALDLVPLLISQGQLDQATEVAEAMLHQGGADRQRELRLITLLVAGSLLDPRLHASAIRALGRVDPGVDLSAASAGSRPEVLGALAQLGARLSGALPGEASVLSTLAVLHLVFRAPLDRTADIAQKALAGGRLLREVSAVSPVFWHAPMPLMFADRYEDCAAAIDEALADSRRRGLELGVATASSYRTILNFRRGRVDDAIADGRFALSSQLLRASPVDTCFATTFLVDALIDADQLDEAAAAITASGMGDAAPEHFPLAMLVSARGKVRLAGGDLPGGAALLRAAGPVLDIATPEVLTPWRGPLALALAGLGQVDEARAVAAENLALVRPSGSRWALGAGLRVAGLVEEDLDLLEASVEVLGQTDAHLEHARSSCDLGAALQRAGDRRRALEVLERAVDLADRCGAGRVAARARREVVLAGGRPRQPAAGVLDGLTPSERRVVIMARDGMSNRAIAQALFVSLRTVETHLTHAYTKLGVASRQGLRSLPL